MSGAATSCVESACLTVCELAAAEKYWIKLIQEDHLSAEMPLPSGSCLLPFCLFLDSDGIVCVGG